MPELSVFWKVIILQVVIASGVVYVLKRLLDRELVLMALEQAQGFRPSEETQKAGKAVVIAAGRLPSDQQARISSVLKEKLPGLEVEFLENAELRGGLVIQIAGEVWDYSLMNRLKHLFS